MLSDAERGAWVTYLTTGAINDALISFDPGEHGRLWTGSEASDRILHKRQFLKRMVAAFPHIIEMEKRGRNLPEDTRKTLQNWIDTQSLLPGQLMQENLAWVRWIILSDVSSKFKESLERPAKKFVLRYLKPGFVGIPTGSLSLVDEGYIEHIINLISLDERVPSEQLREPTIGPDLDEENAVNEMLRRDFLRIVGRFKHTQRFPRHPVEAYARMDEEGVFEGVKRPRPDITDAEQEVRFKMIEKHLIPPPLPSEDPVENLKDDIVRKRQRMSTEQMLEENDNELRDIETQIRKHPYLASAIPMHRPDFVRLTRADPDYLKGTPRISSKSKSKAESMAYQKDLFVARLRDHGADLTVHADEAKDTRKKRLQNLYKHVPQEPYAHPVEFGKITSYMAK
jgi:hypothetical protein